MSLKLLYVLKGGVLVRPRGDLVSGSSLKLRQLLYLDQG